MGREFRAGNVSRTGSGLSGGLRAGKAEFAGAALCAEAVGELELSARLGRDGGVGRDEAGEGEQAVGLVKAEPGAKLAGSGAEDAAAERGVERAEAFDLKGERCLAGGGGVGPAAAADGLAGQDQVREDACEFGGPAGLFFAGDLGEVGEGAVDGRVLRPENRKDRMADAVASESFVGVGGVFAPGLGLGLQEEAQAGAGGGEQGAQDATVRDFEDGGDGGDAFGPGSAEELHQDGLGLVVQRVSGEHGVGLAGGDEAAEGFVAEVAGGFFEGFAVGGGVGARIDGVDGEGNLEAGAEGFDKGLVLLGFLAAEGVIDVNGGKTDAERVAGQRVGGVEEQEECDGVGSAGDGACDAVAGANGGGGEGKHRTLLIRVCLGRSVNRARLEPGAADARMGPGGDG